MRKLLLPHLFALALSLSIFLSYPNNLHALTLDMPIQCTLNKDCFIQNYPDHDTSTGFKDYRCGEVLGYDAHDGTDFRLVDYQAMRKGVNVLAAADGVVRGMRDEVKDFSLKNQDKDAVKNIECGNGVALTHADGWETQYCHMKKGSLRVKKGQVIKKGEILGQVGLSGKTEFPHLHFSITSSKKQKIDPFTGKVLTTSCSNSSLKPSDGLWSNAALQKLSYMRGSELASGFSDHPITITAIEDNSKQTKTLSSASPILAYWVHWMGLEKNDMITLTLTAPDGSTLATHTETLSNNKATYFRFIGSKKHAGNWPKGTYTGQYTITRKTSDALSNKIQIKIE